MAGGLGIKATRCYAWKKHIVRHRPSDKNSPGASAGERDLASRPQPAPAMAWHYEHTSGDFEYKSNSFNTVSSVRFSTQTQFRQWLVSFLAIHTFEGSAEWADVRFHTAGQNECQARLFFSCLPAYGTKQTYPRKVLVKRAGRILIHG